MKAWLKSKTAKTKEPDMAKTVDFAFDNGLVQLALLEQVGLHHLVIGQKWKCTELGMAETVGFAYGNGLVRQT